MSIQEILIPTNPYEGLEETISKDKATDLSTIDGTRKWDVIESTHTGGTEIQYASEVMNSSTATKPRLNYCESSSDLPKLSHLVWEKIRKRTLTSAEAVAYLWAVGPEFTGKINTAWKSYKIQIVSNAEGGDVNVQSLLHAVKASNKVLETVDTGKELRNSIPFLAGICLAPHRVVQGMKADYVDGLKKRMWTQIRCHVDPEMKKEELDQFDFAGWIDHNLDWSQERDYGVIVAAYDMFWSKCKDNKYASLRVCTIRSRYLDCTAFMGWQYLRNITKSSFLELATWIWDESIASEFRQVFKKGEELDKEDSYLPYLSSMKISRKSPYSASVNPYLHMWIHSYGCLKSTTRSYNAKMVGEINTDIPLKNAAFMWIAKSQGGEWKRSIVYEGDNSQTKKFVSPDVGGESKKGKKKDIIPLPPKPEARYWHRYVQANGNSLPAYMWDTVGKTLASIPTPRSQSIGEHLRRWGVNQQIVNMDR